MNIRDMAVRRHLNRHGDAVSLMFTVQLSDRSIFTVSKSLPITLEELPDLLFDVGKQFQQLILDKDK